MQLCLEQIVTLERKTCEPLVPSSVRTSLNYPITSSISHPPKFLKKKYLKLYRSGSKQSNGNRQHQPKDLIILCFILSQTYTSSVPTELDSPITSTRLENQHYFTSLQVWKQKCSQQLPSYLPYIQSVRTNYF